MEQIEIFTIIEDDEILIDAIIADYLTIHFRIKNIIPSLMEATAVVGLKSNSIEDNDKVSFYLKLKSDSNKEQFVRILKSAFDDKDRKLVFPWTLIIAKVCAEIEDIVRSRKQDFLASEIEDKEATWLMEPFVQENQINTIFGMGSSGKTLLSLYFAKQISQDHNCKVLFIDYEDTASGWKSKLSKITGLLDFNTPLSNFIYFNSEQIPISEQVDKIKSVIKAHKIKLVIIDSASLATGESTSDEKATVRLVSALKLLNTTILLIAHQRKNDGDRTPIGSIQYENQSRNVWNVKGTPDDADNTKIHIACSHTKANNTWLRRNPLGFLVEYGEQIRITKESAMDYFEEKYSIKQRIEKLLKYEGEFDYKGVADSLGISTKAASRHLAEGKSKGLFENTNDGKWRICQPKMEDFSQQNNTYFNN